MTRRIALLVDGPNMWFYCDRAQVSLSRILGNIMSIAQSHGDVPIRRAYFSGHTRRHPNVIKAVIENGLEPIIGQSSREDYDVDGMIIKDAETYVGKPDIDALSIASGDAHFEEVAVKTRLLGKDFLLIYPFDTPTKKLVEASTVAVRLEFPPVELSKSIAQGAQHDSPNYRP